MQYFIAEKVGAFCVVWASADAKGARTRAAATAIAARILVMKCVLIVGGGGCHQG